MSESFLYLFKVSAGLGIIFLPYYFLFRNDPNLTIKRFYLLSGLAASWIFPLLTFRRPELLVNLSPTVFIDPSVTDLQLLDVTSSGPRTGVTINWIQVLMITYVSGLVLMFLKNLFILIKWNLSWQRNRNHDGVAYTRTDQVFTLFTRIFVPASLRDQQDLDNVLLHEQAHIKQLHYIDLMLMEITLLLTWFNPFSWLISRMIKENHEHLADRQVLSAGINPARYRAQLLNHTLGVNVFRLGNQFNHSLTLKRFNMMKKPRKSPLGLLKIALLIPAVLFTLGLTIGMTPRQETIQGKVIFAENGEPATGAAVIIKGTTVGTVTDENGNFMLIVDGDPEIVVSFVGYATLTVKASRIGSKPLKLEQKVFELDPGPAPDRASPIISGSISFTASDDSEDSPVIVLDGKVVTKIENLDPGAIERVEVFKDPDSEIARKYNTSHGVILITSKKDLSTSEEMQPKEIQTGKKEILEPAMAKAILDETGSYSKGDEVFYIVEDMPSFPGGTTALNKYIYSNLEYPEDAREKGITGEVLVQFLVTYSGKLEDIRVARSSYAGFDKPALDVFIDMPDWNPGKQRGKRVQVQVVVPVRFNASAE